MLLSSPPRLFALATALLSAAAVFAVGTPEVSFNAPPASPLGANGVQRAGGPPADAHLAADRSNWSEKLRRTPIDVDPASTLFGSKNWTPPPPVAKAAPSVPSVPSFPFQYMGKLVLDGGETTLYLTKDDEIYSVKAGAVVDGNYRLERVGADYLEVTYLPLNKKQKVAFSSIVPPARSERNMIAMGSGNTPVTPAQAITPSPSRSPESSPPTSKAQPASSAMTPAAVPAGQAVSAVEIGSAGGESAPTTTGNTGGMVILPQSRSEMPMLAPSVSKMPMVPPQPGATMPMIPPPAGATMPMIPPGGSLTTTPVPSQ